MTLREPYDPERHGYWREDPQACVGAAMIGAEAFRAILVEIEFVDRDDIERAGICPDTAARMMRDPTRTFKAMSVGERKRFWPLVVASMERARMARERIEAEQILAGEISRYIDPTDESHP